MRETKVTVCHFMNYGSPLLSFLPALLASAGRMSFQYAHKSTAVVQTTNAIAVFFLRRGATQISAPRHALAVSLIALYGELDDITHLYVIP